jgi:protein-L-isoaspartate O-methyltransferase
MDSRIDEPATAQLSGSIGQWDQAATCLAALAVTLETGPGTGPENGEDGPLASAARDVMAATGLGTTLSDIDRLPFSPEELRAIAASALLQGAALARRAPQQDDGWAHLDDPTLTAQGRASGAAVKLFLGFVVPHVDGLAERLARPDARMLDVGTGIGALGLGFAKAFPELHVTGIDVMPRVLELARESVAGDPAGTRVELRLQDVAELVDESCYDLAWLPAPFVPEAALLAGVPRLVRALRPGGLLMVGHGDFAGTDLQNAITRFKTAFYGGTALDGASAVRLLEDHGLTSVRTLATPPGTPRITVGTR